MFKWNTAAKFVDDLGRLTAEAIRALSPSKEPFKPVKIATGTIGTTVLTKLQSNDQGFYIVKNREFVLGAITLTRGSIAIELATESIIPACPGDVIKFSHTVDANPAFMPSLFFASW
jgi:hypothetical protein